MARHDEPDLLEALTPREQEVRNLLKTGLTDGEIGEFLRISTPAVKRHVSAMIGKLGVRNRHEAASWPDSPPWWTAALAPVAFLWRRPSFGWLSPASAAVVGIVAATGLGLLAWGLVRTDGGGDDAAALVAPTPGPPATVPPPGKLVWEGGSIDIESVDPGTCGDAATADAHGVPMMLRITRGGLLGLEPEPYEYVAAQVNPAEFGPYDSSPEGWELNRRVFAVFVDSGGGDPDDPPWPRFQELFLRRLDQPTLLFRYAAGYCNQEDGSPAAPTRGFPRRTRIEMPADPPEVTRYSDGDYLSSREAMDVAEDRYQGLRPVRAELGTIADLGVPSGGISGAIFLSRQDAVRWAILLAGGDQFGPKRAGTEYGVILQIDATTGALLEENCCYSLVGGS